MVIDDPVDAKALNAAPKEPPEPSPAACGGVQLQTKPQQASFYWQTGVLYR